MTRDELVGRSLPAIGEETRGLLALAGGVGRSLEASAAAASPVVRTPPPTPPPTRAPSLSPSSSSRASSVSSSASAPPPVSQPPWWYHSEATPLRRRFLSSDVVTKSSPSVGARYSSPVAKFYASRNVGESPTLALRRWMTAKTKAARSITRSFSLNRSASSRDGDPTEDDDAVVVRSRPRTMSETCLQVERRVGIELFPVKADEGESSGDDVGEADEEDEQTSDQFENSSDEEDDQMQAQDQEIEAVSANSDAQRQEKLQNLQKLFQEGFITVTEYKDRRVQLVGELSVVAEHSISKATDLLNMELPIIYHEPPDFALLRERDAIKHVFDSVECKWTSSRIKVKIDPQPFARGGLRLVFHLQDLSTTVTDTATIGGVKYDSYVAKVSMNPNENPATYFRDVEMQAVAAKFATQYNSYNPPRRVEFVEAWILQLIPPSGQNGGGDMPEDLTLHGAICGVEPYIAGEYHKHNNNFGYVSELERNTPQAFSHFTYEASDEQILVVDIQGVGDHYTDPQIHTRRGKVFGKGNLSVRGFERFLGSHRCNPICRYLKLPLINPKDDPPSGVNGEDAPSVDPKGTIPAQTYMNKPHVDKVNSVLCHYYSESKAFERYRPKGKQQRMRPAMHTEPRGNLREEDKDHCGQSRSVPAARAGAANGQLTTRLLMDLIHDQRSCSLFCGAEKQCSIS